MLENQPPAALLNAIEDPPELSSPEDLHELHQLARFHASRYDRSHPHCRTAIRLFDAIWSLPADTETLREVEPQVRHLVAFMTEETHQGYPEDFTRAMTLALEHLELTCRRAARARELV